MSNKFAGKVALVTGGGSGIGQGTSIRLAQEGAHVLLVDLDLAAAQQTQATIEAAGGRATAVQCNIADSAQVNDVVTQLLKEQPIDILVNNAGIAHIGNIEGTSESDLDRLYNVNIKGVYNMMAAVIGSMKARKHGVIVNLASVASSVGIADRFAYSMTKGAVLTMTYSVAKDYLNDGIRCNCVAPGRVHTPFVDNFIAQNYPDNQDEMFEKLSKTQPIGRMGTVDEVASVIVYLCSDDAAFITGTNFPVDGGFVTLNN